MRSKALAAGFLGAQSHAQPRNLQSFALREAEGALTLKKCTSAESTSALIARLRCSTRGE